MSRVTHVNITIEDLCRFYVKYHNDPIFKHQRFGQGFCNEYDLTCSELFYEEYYHKAWEYIIEKFVGKCSICGAGNSEEYDLYCTQECMNDPE